MSAFSDRPLVAGSLVGLRAFDVDRLGRLAGPAQKTLFKPGENVATCLLNARDVYPWTTAAYQFNVTLDGYTYYSYLDSEHAPEVESASEPEAPHQVGSVDCACGFYAYFDGKNDYARSDPSRLAAVVEGYGVCTVGDRGFRAEKMRLLALIDPTQTSKWRGVGDVWSALVIALLVCALAINVVGGHWGAAGISAALLGFNLICNVAMWTTRPRRKIARGDYRAAYPDVPVFKSEKEALKHFPLTPPPAPSLKDDNFWTVSA